MSKKERSKQPSAVRVLSSNATNLPKAGAYPQPNLASLLPLDLLKSDPSAWHTACRLILRGYPQLLTDILIQLYRAATAPADTIHLAIARLFYDHGYYDNAFNTLSDYIISDPYSRDAYALLSSLYSQNYQPARITTLFETAIQHDIWLAVIVAELPKFYTDQDNIKGLIWFYESWETHHNTISPYHIELAMAYEQAGNYTAAAARYCAYATESLISIKTAYNHLSGVINRCRSFGCFHYMLTLLYKTPDALSDHLAYAQQVYPVAPLIDWYQRAQADYPDYPDFWLGLLAIYQKDPQTWDDCHGCYTHDKLATLTLSDDQRAIWHAHIKTALASYTLSITSQVGLCQHLIQQSQYKCATEIIRQLLDTPAFVAKAHSLIQQLQRDAPSQASTYVYAKYALKSGDVAASFKATNTLLTGSYRTVALIIRSEASALCHKHWHSVTTLIDLIHIYPANSHYFQRLLIAQDTRCQQSIDQIMAAQHYRASHYRLGVLYYRLGHLKAAVSHIQRLDQTQPRIAGILARCFVEMNQLSLATTLFHSLDVKPYAHHSHWWQAIIALQQGHIEIAWQHHDWLLRHAINTPRITALGQCISTYHAYNQHPKLLGLFYHWPTQAIRYSVIPAKEFLEHLPSQTSQIGVTSRQADVYNNQAVNHCFTESVPQPIIQDLLQSARTHAPNHAIATHNLSLISDKIEPSHAITQAFCLLRDKQYMAALTAFEALISQKIVAGGLCYLNAGDCAYHLDNTALTYYYWQQAAAFILLQQAIDQRRLCFHPHQITHKAILFSRFHERSWPKLQRLP